MSPPPHNALYDEDKSRFIFRKSFLSLFSCLYAIYNKHYDLAFVPGGVFLTSINYWRHPIYGWRRNVDICYVGSSLIYQCVRAYHSQYRFLHYLTMGLAMTCYPIGRYHYNNGEKWHSAYYHSMIHVIANISNIILYSGYIGNFGLYI